MNMHETTVLGTAVWSALNETRPEHLEIIETLLRAGAKRESLRQLVSSQVEGPFAAIANERLGQIEAILNTQQRNAAAAPDSGRPVSWQLDTFVCSRRR